VTLLVDTSVWSLALRRDTIPDEEHVQALERALEGAELIVTTGVIIQELLQGFKGPAERDQIIDRFAALPLISPDRHDHIAAADLHNLCRRSGVQFGTIDALLAQLCIRHNLTMLTTDKDFSHAASHCSLQIWGLTPLTSDSPVHDDVDALLRKAIDERRLIGFVLDGKPRIAEPHDYGVIAGEPRLFFYQVGGESRSGRRLGWRWAVVSKMSEVTLKDRTFKGPRPAVTGKHVVWEKLYASVSTRLTSND